MVHRPDYSTIRGNFEIESYVFSDIIKFPTSFVSYNDNLSQIICLGTVPLVKAELKKRRK